MRPFQRASRSALVIALAGIGLLLPTAAAADTPPLRLIDVVQVSWAGAPTATATGDSVARAIQNDTIARWRTLSSDRIVFTFDAVLPRITTATAMPCDAQGSVAYLNKVALDAFTKAGITEWGNRYLVVIAPRVSSCVWAGRGLINPPGSTAGLLILNGTDDEFIIAHELGHNLGLGHSNLETCTGGRADGAWADCSAIEYGSATDLMSNSDKTSALAAYHQWRLGFIPDADVVVADRTMSVGLEPVDTSTGTRAIFVRDATAAYWVEYRKADPSNEIGAGLVIYRTDAPPASSVITPVDQPTDSIDMGLTTDVWMISLGGYSYVYPPSGSPSLVNGSAFTTAFGAVTMVARVNAAGGVFVDVTRNTSRAPAAPVWTDQMTWSEAGAPVVRTDLDTGGSAIAHFDARFVSETGTTNTTLAATAYTNVGRTALSPLGTGVSVRADALPEGNYSLELRAVTVSGVAGAWSTRRALTVDHGVPQVTGGVEIAAVTPARSTTLRWVGARDAGVGVCSARAYGSEGFANLQWSAAKGATPSFQIGATTSSTYRAVVRDCFGNQSWGDLQLNARWQKAASFTRTGKWTSTSTPRCATGTCTATLRSAEGSTAIIVGRGTATVFVDGQRRGVIRAARASSPRVGFRVAGAHRITISSRDLELLGAQSADAAWSATTAPEGTAASDPTLSDDDQAALAKFGFTNDDFLPGTTVSPLTGGTTTDQATLDLCNASFPSEGERQFRRQVAVSGPTASSYLFVSTETVRYWSDQAARRAAAEIEAAATLCKSSGYAVTATGAKEPYLFAALPALPAGLRPAADRRIYSITIGEGTSVRTALLAYQFNGAVLSALYVVREGAGSIDAATTKQWLEVAAVIAGRLTNRG